MAATKLETARTIGGVAFDGTANINLPGVNTAGNQSTTGNAATATKLATARTINGTAFDGTANISLTAANVGAIATTGGTATGNITAPDFIQSSTQSTNAAACTRKDYVDSAIAAGDALQVSKTGDTMTGNLSMSGNTEIRFTAFNTGCSVANGSGDGATQDKTNLQIKSWQGIGISPTAGLPAGMTMGQNSIWINARSGAINSIGLVTANGFRSDNTNAYWGAKPGHGMTLGMSTDNRTLIGGGGSDGIVVIRPLGTETSTAQTIFEAGGTIWNSIAPTSINHLTNKGYVDSAIAAGDALQVSKTGDTMTGNLTAPTFTGALAGNAATATKLATAR